MTDYDRDYYDIVFNDRCCGVFVLGAMAVTAVCVLIYFCVR